MAKASAKPSDKPKTAKPADEPVIKICTELNAVGEKALTAAIRERRSNALGIAPGDSMAMAMHGPAMAAIITKLWKVGRTLKVSYIGTIDPFIRNKIETIA